MVMQTVTPGITQAHPHILSRRSVPLWAEAIVSVTRITVARRRSDSLMRRGARRPRVVTLTIPDLGLNIINTLHHPRGRPDRGWACSRTAIPPRQTCRTDPKVAVGEGIHPSVPIWVQGTWTVCHRSGCQLPPFTWTGTQTFPLLARIRHRWPLSPWIGLE